MRAELNTIASFFITHLPTRRSGFLFIPRFEMTHV
jgi:hypothetical protein